MSAQPIERPGPADYWVDMAQEDLDELRPPDVRVLKVRRDLMRRRAQSLRAMTQPRDERGRFVKMEVRYGTPPGHGMLDVQDGGVPTPRYSVWAQWPGGTATKPIIYTQVAATDVMWRSWQEQEIPGWTLTGTGSTTRFYNVYDPRTQMIETTYATPVRTWQQWIGDNEYNAPIQQAYDITNTTITTVTMNETVWRQWHVMERAAQQAAEGARRMAERTQEMADRLQQQREAASRERLAREQRSREAEVRARELLMMILTPEERIYLENTGDILVRGSEGGLYVVQTRYNGSSVHGNVYETDEHGCNLGRVCVAPGMYDRDEEGRTTALPPSDGFVGQVLAIRHGEGQFRAAGNWSGRRGCAHQHDNVVGRTFLPPAA